MAAGRETTLIVGDRYTSRSRLLGLWEGAFIYDEPVAGAWLRYCRAGARTRTVSVHWSCPPAASRFTPRPVTSSSTRRARLGRLTAASHVGVRADALRRVRMIVLGRDCVS